MTKIKTTIEQLTYGDEPIWQEKHVNSPSSTSTFLNWYSYTKESEHAKKYLLNYVKFVQPENKELIAFIEKENDKNLKKTYCWLMRIITKSEALIPSVIVERVSSYILELERALKESKTVKKVKPENFKPQNKVHPKSHLLTMKVLDTRLDNFIETKQLSKLNLKEYLKEFSHSDDEIKLVLTFIHSEHNHWKQVIEDKEIYEGYNFLTKKEIKLIESIYAEYETDVKSFIDDKLTQKSIKKPRKKKKIKPENLVKKMKHKLEDSDLNIKSIDSKTIIGKNCLLVFNVKTRQLSIYHSDTGFSVKGSTLLNFNVESSFGKVLRNPEKEIDKYLIINKNVLETKINDIKAVKKKLTGRINSDTVLLKVF